MIDTIRGLAYAVNHFLADTLKMTADEVRTIIKARVGDGSQREFAKQIRLSPSYVNDVINGLREPSGRLLDALGLRRIMVYEYKRGKK